MRVRGTRDSQSGSIAILALWASAIVAILLAVATRTTGFEVRATQNALGWSRARAAAEAGTQLGLLRLLRSRAEGVMAFDGKPETWRDNGLPVEISIVDEAGKIDLNQAPLELLSGLFMAVGRSRDEALLLGCNVLDRRGESGPLCPEPSERTLRRPQLFAVPEELAQVPGVEPSLYDVVADYVTVASKASAIDPRAAQRPVLLAIPGANATLVDTYLEARARWGELVNADSATALALFRSVPAVTTSPAREFTIKAVAGGSPGIRYRADLQVRLTEFPARPYEVVAMRAPPPDRGRAAPAVARRIP